MNLKSKVMTREEEIHKAAKEFAFSYRGLIDKGLAIDATNLNIY